MFSRIIIFLSCFAMCYYAFAFTVFEFRNPKANKTTYYTYFIEVIKFEKLERFQ